MSSIPKVHQRAVRLQKKILKSLQAEAELLLGPTPASILKYGRENRKDFSPSGGRLKPVPRSEWIQAIQRADVTFLADFHTFDQAQRSALRIFREVISEGSSWCIGLEMVPSQFQSVLDDFQAGKINVQKFHELISYREEWGFPWKNYAPIFEWARIHEVHLIALNRPRAIFRPEDEQELHDRDQWAAGIITDLFCTELSDLEKFEGNVKKFKKLKKDLKMLVLYGELHVGSSHLPKKLAEISKTFLGTELSSVILHQNNDPLYWKATQEGLDLQSDAILLKKNIYCIFSGTPWAKLQSLISCTEEGLPDSSDSSESEDGFTSHDYLDMIRTYGDAISEFLRIAPPTYDRLSVYSIEQPDFLEHLNDGQLFTQLEMKLIRFQVTQNRNFYIPRVSAVYLGSSGSNAAAELAALYILRTKNKSEILFLNTLEDFYRLILENCFGFFGSLILNPMRKCDFLKEHLKRVEALHAGEKVSYPFEKEAREILILGVKSFLNGGDGGGDSRSSGPDPDLKEGGSLMSMIQNRKLAPAVLLGAKYLGRIFGRKLHRGVLSGEVLFQDLAGVFFDSEGTRDPLSPREPGRLGSRAPRQSKFYESRFKVLLQAVSKIQIVNGQSDLF